MNLKLYLRRIPGLVPAYRFAVYLRIIARDSFDNAQRYVDGILVRGDWDYTLPVQQQRYARTLAAVSKLRGETDWGEVLEVGCYEGLFTTELARRSASVTAFDISSMACERAAKRCAEFPHVSFKQLNVIREPIPGQYDLAFVMGVLEMMHGARALGRVVANLARTIRPGGLLVINDPFMPCDLERTWWARWLAEGARNRSAFIAKGRRGFRLVSYHEVLDKEAFPGYLIAVYERTSP